MIKLLSPVHVSKALLRYTIESKGKHRSFQMTPLLPRRRKKEAVIEMGRAAQDVCPLYELHTDWQILQVILICFSLYSERENDHLIIRIKNNLANRESHMSAVWLVVRFVGAWMQLRQRCYLLFYWMDSTWWRTVCLHRSKAAWELCLSLHRRVRRILRCLINWFYPRVG